CRCHGSAGNAASDAATCPSSGPRLTGSPPFKMASTLPGSHCSAFSIRALVSPSNVAFFVRAVNKVWSDRPDAARTSPHFIPNSLRRLSMKTPSLVSVLGCFGIAPSVVYAAWFGKPKLSIERHPVGVTVHLDEFFLNSHPQRGGQLVTTRIDWPMYGARQRWSGEATPVGAGKQCIRPIVALPFGVGVGD